MRKTTAGYLTLLGLALSTAGCNSNQVASGGVVYDSAGVRITNNKGPLWETSESWTVSSSPVHVITQAGPDEPLYNVVSAFLLSDGRIIVLNGGTRQIFYFAKGGRYLQSVGRKGEGPGEFRIISNPVLLGGDSLLVADPLLRRLTILGPEGRVANVIDGSAPLGRMEDGSLVRQERASVEVQPREGPFRRSVALIRYSLHGTSDEDTLFTVPGDELYGVTDSYDTGVRGFTGYRRPLGRVRRVAVHGSKIHTVDGSAFEVATYDSTGRLVSLARLNQELTPVSNEDKDFWTEELFGRIPAGRSRARVMRMLDGPAFPEHMPAFQDLQVDLNGNIWLEAFATRPQQASTWFVIEPGGRWRGTVTMPAGLRVTHITDSLVAGVLKDSFDVERVVLFRLIKP